MLRPCLAHRAPRASLEPTVAGAACGLGASRALPRWLLDGVDVSRPSRPEQEEVRGRSTSALRHSAGVKRVLITGMSGTGKSTVIRMLAERGYKAVDADDGLSESVPIADPAHRYSSAEREWLWREDLVQELLSTEDTDVLFISGTSRSQVGFYAQFDHVVLLTAPADQIVERLARRTTNPYGKDLDELAEVLQLQQTVEPRLRTRASLEVDTQMPADDVVAAILDVVLDAEAD